MTSKSWIGTCVAGALVLTAVAGCGGRQTDNTTDNAGANSEIACTVTSDTRIAIATGNTTGVYYVVGNALATQITQATGDKVKASAAETGASVGNIKGLDKGDYQVAFSLFDSATDAVQGKGSFDKPVKIAALGRIYDNATHVVVRAGSGINSVADMKGKRISTGSPNSGTEVIAQRLLKAAGLDPDKDIQPQRLDLAKTTEGVKAGTIDGFFWSGGLPTAGVTDLFTTNGDKVKFLDLSGLLPEMQKLGPAYQEGTIPAATYKTPGDVKTIVVPNVLLVREDMNADLACVLTKTLVEKREELAKANPAAKGITLETIRRTDPVPLHRGAVAALDKAGAAK
ncbi:TAXI family TRAP transporter solute-binding subunit [Dactylosporangium fulvum]|uniref:TAXI family TRAP transporter solute-binding subunit n=1 Tax=Dactylosporangium fulvum TaxID=53359 RepID=A0ABY5VZV4_9ACTN|nr:TAXI family TRAP transporter solute-binding subunit [Dactylosporangium fulvum]UWP81311.1 TAXI family TRAP transporter solute-binding subunit [Dactylosporangium fulvum]